MSKREREDDFHHNSVFRVENIANGLVNGEVQCKPKRVPKTPNHLPKLPALIGAFGVVKAGKSNALTNLIKEYFKYGSLNYLYCISPTYHSNSSLQTIPFTADGVYTDPRTCVMSLQRILDDIKAKNDDYLFEERYKKAYKNWFRNNGNVTIQENHLLNKEDFRRPIDIPWPCPGIFIDDMTHTELMANTINNKLSHLSLQHRHLEGVGVTIFQAFQTFRSGMPRVVRQNLGVIILFPTCNLKEIEEIYSEVTAHISLDTFKRLFFEATKDSPHNFLLINKLADDPSKQFGINFNKVFVIDINAERRKVLKLNES